MAETASQLINGIENPPLNNQAFRPVMKKVGTGGRPPLDSYLEPEETEEIAVTAERIQENYPFFGTLLKHDNGHFRRKEVISRQHPQTIEQIEQRYGAGKYQVRLKKEDGSEDQINFSISGEATQPVTRNPEPISDQHFMESIRRDVREEARQDFEQIIDSLERRLKAKNGELDDLTGNVRRLTMELAETERQSNSTVRSETAALQQKIEDLKEDISELKFENFELQQELKYADVDTGFDFKEVLSDALKNPDLVKFVAPLLARLQPQTQPAATPALAGNVDNPEFRNQEPEPANNEAEPETRNTQPDQEQMQYLINQFSAVVVKTVSSAMISGNPGPDGVKKVITEGIHNLQGNGLQTAPGLWIQIAKALIDVAVHKGVSAAKAAETIGPVFEQMDGAADQLKFITPAMATEYIINRFGIDVNPQQKEFLTQVLKVFKQQLKEN